MRYLIKQSKISGKFYWVLKANNNETIATSETYNSLQACKKGINAVKKTWFAKIVIELNENNKTQKGPKSKQVRSEQEFHEGET